MQISVWIVKTLGSGWSLLLIAVVGWYAASQAARSALCGRFPGPGKRAIAQTACTATLVVIAVIFGDAEAAVGIVFATSIACLTLVLGIATVTAQETAQTATDRSWAFVLPVALIALMAGFSGAIGIVPMAVLLVEGLALLMFWNRPPAQAEVAPVESHEITKARIALFVMAIVAAAVASLAGWLAARTFCDGLGLPRTDLATALMLAPAMVLPLIGWGSGASTSAEFKEVVTTLVACVLLNICALLPLAGIAWAMRPHAVSVVNLVLHSQPAPATAPATTSASTEPAEPAPTPAIAYPMSVWRIDTVLLVALGLLLLPVALGKWNLGMVEGLTLLLTFLIYMMLTTAMAR